MVQHSDGAMTSKDVEQDEELERASRLSTDNDPERVRLFLLSQLPSSLWSTGCMHGLHEIELKLRIAQANDALEQLKQHLCVYSGLVHYKITQVSGPGQKANTRARSLLDRFWEKVMRCAERYKIARAALETLDPTGNWQERFKPLLASDLKGPNGRSPDDAIAAMSKRAKRTGEGLREVSWIWRVRRQLPHLNAEASANIEGSKVTSEADLDGRKSSLDFFCSDSDLIIRYKS